MFNTPQEAPAKKPLTTSKPGGPLAGLAMESREEHPKQSKSDSKRLKPVKSSRDGCPLSKTIKNVSASVLKITSSPRLPQQSQAWQ
ncbi:hypothetical protein BDL97_20G005900 [Sphagnum fallax]|nr:hypothetical protein BDL97_20G005900 [Sphagnum fallax]